uniref:Sulfotransferase domain-containing protein n=1 Tax=Amblyomma maculatum TaxID=34609 RepID=G3MPA1_AMBMU
MDVNGYRDIQGLWMHRFFHEDLVCSALTYKPRPDDVFIVTFPKCGTTWTQYLVLSILTDGQPPKTVTDFMLATPYLELMGAEAAEKMRRPGLLKTHLPFHKQPYSPEARYIYVTRNPYDVCVSFYYHLRSMTPKTETDVSFAKYHKMFISGKGSYGDYFDNLLSWYEHRNDPNVLFFTYEQLKEDTSAWAIKIADFLGEEYGKKLREDPQLLRNVVEASNLRNMQGVFNDKMATLLKDLVNLPPEKALQSMEVYREMVNSPKPLHDDDGFVRKGIVGDWKAHFTPDQIKETKAWIAEKTKGSDVMDLWKDLDLP